MSNTPSDAELDELIFDVYPTYQAPEAHDRIQIREAMKKAVAKWGTPQPAPAPLSEQDILDGLMTTPNSVLENCADAFEAGVRFAAHRHGIAQKGGD